MLFADSIYNYNDLVKRLKISSENILTNNKNTYLNLLAKLEVLNPITTLKRGYSVTKYDNKVIDSINKVSKGMHISTALSDGIIESEITKIEKNSEV